MADPIIEPEHYNDAAAVNTARKADDYIAPASPESAEDSPRHCADPVRELLRL